MLQGKITAGGSGGHGVTHLTPGKSRRGIGSFADDCWAGSEPGDHHLGVWKSPRDAGPADQCMRHACSPARLEYRNFRLSRDNSFVLFCQAWFLSRLRPAKRDPDFETICWAAIFWTSTSLMYVSRKLLVSDFVDEIHWGTYWNSPCCF